MHGFGNDKVVKAMAFEKAVLEILKRDNPDLKEYYLYEELIGGYKRRYQYDAVVFNRLNLYSFDKDSIVAPKIVVEIKSGRPSIDILRHFLRSVENSFDVAVFILAIPKSSNMEAKITSEKCNIIFIYEDELINSVEIKNVLYHLDEYIISKNNILIPDNYSILKTIKTDLSFALGAGCSRRSNISDWNTLSEALGFELLYNIVDTKQSVYKNKIVADELNKSIFSCFDKNSALDAIHNSFMMLPSTGQRDYWLSIKKVLYMNYEGPIDAKQPLINSIVSCIKRRKIDSIINYNFDSVIEQNINPDYQSTAKEIQDSVTNMLGCDIYHVHGYIPFDYNGKIDVNNFVFTDKDYYENMLSPNSFSNVTQTHILQNKNVIFVGVSFTDSNMKEILRQRVSKGCSKTIFAFLKLPDFNFEGTNNKLMKNKYKLIQESYFETLGVKILWVDNFEEIPAKIDLI